MTKIIVEICQNHNGDKNVIRDLLHAAKEGGADIVKGQLIFSEDLTHRFRFDEGEETESGVRKTMKRPYKAEYERLRNLDLGEEEYHFFVEEAKRVGITPMLTVFSRNRISFAASLPWGAERLVKIASYDCGSHKMIRELTDHFDTFIVSTGASFNDEIKKTAEILKEHGKKFVFLHCVTSYPNTLEMAHLSRMGWLRQYSQEVGWSDHTLVSRDGIRAAKVAALLGADYIERHFTILPSDQTKDGPISITPAFLKELSEFVKLPKEEQRVIVEKEIPEWQMLLGFRDRDMTQTEMLNRDYYRGRFASLVGGQRVHNWDE